MTQVTGFEGTFLREDDPQCLYSWYEQNLGISSRYGCFSFQGGTQRAYIAVAFFPRTSDHFPPSQPAMLNFQVDDLDGVLDRSYPPGW